MSLLICSSGKNLVSMVPPTINLSWAKSITHLCLRSMSNPNKRSKDVSKTRNEQGSWISESPMSMGTSWMRPSIILDPTPTAWPTNFLSIKWSSCNSRAKLGDMIVIWAPESTNAWTFSPWIVTSMKSMCTEVNASGVKSNANSIFSWTCCSLINSKIRAWLAGLSGSCWSRSSSCCCDEYEFCIMSSASRLNSAGSFKAACKSGWVWRTFSSIWGSPRMRDRSSSMGSCWAGGGAARGVSFCNMIKSLSAIPNWSSVWDPDKTLELWIKTWCAGATSVSASRYALSSSNDNRPEISKA